MAPKILLLGMATKSRTLPARKNADCLVHPSGSTGYIGGSILDHLLKSNSPTLRDVTITCMVRGEDRVSKLDSEYGKRVNAVIFRDLDETDRIIDVAGQHPHISYYRRVKPMVRLTGA